MLIAGAGEAGALILRELRANPQTGLIPVGFVDDDPHKHGMLIQRVRVLGGREAIPALVREHQVDQVIIAMPGAPGARPCARSWISASRPACAPASSPACTSC